VNHEALRRASRRFVFHLRARLNFKRDIGLSAPASLAILLASSWLASPKAEESGSRRTFDESAAGAARMPSRQRDLQTGQRAFIALGLRQLAALRNFQVSWPSPSSSAIALTSLHSPLVLSAPTCARAKVASSVRPEATQLISATNLQQCWRISVQAYTAAHRRKSS